MELSQISVIADKVGIDTDDLNECIEDQRHVDVLVRNYQEGLDATAGRIGTPFSVVFAADGSRTVVSGAQPMDNWVSLIDTLLAK